MLRAPFWTLLRIGSSRGTRELLNEPIRPSAIANNERDDARVLVTVRLIVEIGAT